MTMAYDAWTVSVPTGTPTKHHHHAERGRRRTAALVLRSSLTPLVVEFESTARVGHGGGAAVVANPHLPLAGLVLAFCPFFLRVQGDRSTGLTCGLSSACVLFRRAAYMQWALVLRMPLPINPGLHQPDPRGSTRRRELSWTHYTYTSHTIIHTTQRHTFSNNPCLCLPGSRAAASSEPTDLASPPSSVHPSSIPWQADRSMHDAAGRGFQDQTRSH